jgi:hypothetical protein
LLGGGVGGFHPHTLPAPLMLTGLRLEICFRH